MAPWPTGLAKAPNRDLRCARVRREGGGLCVRASGRYPGWRSLAFALPRLEEARLEEARLGRGAWRTERSGGILLLDGHRGGNFEVPQ